MRRFVTAASRLPRWTWKIVACLVVGGLAIGSYRSPVDRGFKDADLREANTQAAVVAILGPPGDYSTREQPMWMVTIGQLPRGRPVEWKDDYARVVVYFAPDGHKTYWNVGKPTPDN
jgi:hypothetical protein